MFTGKLPAILFLCAILGVFSPASARAQQDETEPTTVSNLTDAVLPWGAARVLPGKVPAEFEQAFENLLKQGEGKIAGAGREVLIWEGNYKNKSNAAKLTGELQANLKKEGWQYESAGRDAEVEFFTLMKEGAARRVVLGFYVPGDEVFVCAWMEVVSAGAQSPTTATSRPETPSQTRQTPAAGGSIVGKWFRTVGGSTIDSTGKTTLKGGEDFTFEFFADGTVEYTRKKEIINFMQCHINASDTARGRYSLSGSTLTINLGAMKSVQTNSCNARENYNKVLGASTMTAEIQIRQREDITRPDRPWTMCLDGAEACYERQQ